MRRSRSPIQFPARSRSAGVVGETHRDTQAQGEESEGEGGKEGHGGQGGRGIKRGGRGRGRVSGPWPCHGAPCGAP